MMLQQQGSLHRQYRGCECSWETVSGRDPNGQLVMTPFPIPRIQHQSKPRFCFRLPYGQQRIATILEIEGVFA